MAKKKKVSKKGSFYPYIKAFWIVFGVGVFSVLLLFTFASWGVFGEMPTFERLENPACLAPWITLSYWKCL